MRTKYLPSQRKLKEDFTYDPETGDFVKYNNKIGYVTSLGYWEITYEGNAYLIHRLIWKWWYGEDPNVIDHIDGDKQNNKLNNLRNVTQAINLKNKNKSINNNSGYNGVAWHKSKERWAAYVGINNKQKHIGFYNTAIQANEARLTYINKFHPDTFTDRHGT